MLKKGSSSHPTGSHLLSNLPHSREEGTTHFLPTATGSMTYRGMRMGGVRGQPCCPLPLPHLPLMLLWTTRGCRMMTVAGGGRGRGLHGGSHARRSEVRRTLTVVSVTGLLLSVMLHSTPQSYPPLTTATMLQCLLLTRCPGCHSSHHCTVAVRSRRRRRIGLPPFLLSLQSKNRSESCYTVNYRRGAFCTIFSSYKLLKLEHLFLATPPLKWVWPGNDDGHFPLFQRPH